MVFRVTSLNEPSLLYRFTPDSFEQDKISDSTPVVSVINVSVASFLHSLIAKIKLRSISCFQSIWRNIAQVGIDATNQQNESKLPQQTEVLMQPTVAFRPIYKKNVLNGRGVVRFSRRDTAGATGQNLEFYTSTTSGAHGFASNPFTGTNNE
jgi:hypothetical protein